MKYKTSTTAHTVTKKGTFRGQSWAESKKEILRGRPFLRIRYYLGRLRDKL